MFRYLTKNRKGFSLVELMIVLILLSLGAFALMNIISVAYRSFNKSEERYIKQEAVKQVAKILETGSASVAAAKTADIFATNKVVPTGSAIDKSYSYLFAKESTDEEGNVNGYYICVQNRGTNRSSAVTLSNTPIYISITPYKDINNKGQVEQYNGVIVTLAALEESYSYERDAVTGEIIPPTQDDIFYSLDVAYHFPNMATDDNGALVNHIGNDRASANLYTDTGSLSSGSVFATDGPIEGYGTEYDDPGIVLRVYCDSIIMPDKTESEVSVQSLCFIATASYGKGTGEVGTLCDFRDKCLLTNPLGKAFVKAYYTVSPPIADFIRESEPLKATVRTALKPLIVVAEYSLNSDIRAEGLISLVMVFGCGIGATVTMMKIDKRFRKEERKEK